MEISRTQLPFTCNGCELAFATSVEQRAHMRQSWHVYNLKRRMASLPPMSAERYAEQMPSSTAEPKKPSAPAEPSMEDLADDVEGLDIDEPTPTEEADINQCLFCKETLPTLDINLQHMSSEHGLYIPELDHLASVETFVEYIWGVINQYHECIYCGLAKRSANGVKQHMLEKGHCMINLEREPELLEFWDFSDAEADSDEDSESISKARPEYMSGDVNSASYRKMPDDTLLLASGKIVGSQHEGPKGTTKKRPAKDVARKAITRELDADAPKDEEHPNESTAAQPSRDRRVAVRGAMGLIGVSDQQKRSLMLTEKKMQKKELITRAAASWATERVANKQKFYRASGPMRPNG
ncbi:hypothetical protein BT63DRAFT_136494 [Microthyrium microscopicum]|uniref:C2H2-type domain-containing protein n=1 Tax=Microthyrium microscopicum TaxID=703497 RepID=A0A6A6UM71_9PEZI|nr:hypothetical protein BT63DRAFT_136494 [Microthyrium microscopicum]